MIAHCKKLQIICIYDDWGFSHDHFSQLKATIERSKPAYWEFFNPGTILIYFRATKKGSSKSSSLLNTLEKIKAGNSGLAKIGIGKSEGEMVFETNVFVNIISSPMGGAANEAIKMAKDLAIAY